MEKIDAIAALAALAQENRLDVYRLLVQAGPDGMAAGEVATALGIAPNTSRSISIGCGMPASSAWPARAGR